MTGRAAGRHRVPPRGSPRRPASLLLIDYPAADGPFAGYRVSSFVPVARRRPRLVSFRRRRLRPPARRRATAAALATATVALLAGLALPRSSGGGHDALPILPPESLPHPTATAPSPAVTAPSTAGPATRHQDRARHTSGPGSRLAVARSPYVAAARPSAPVTSQKPAIVVQYLVASQGPAGFQGEIQVTNNTAQPIWDWQIVIALFDDAVTSFTNADGMFSNGILVLSPASPAQVAPPDGGVLHVFFTADGFQTIPAACSFNGISCAIP